MGHCSVSIFEAILQPVCKTIQLTGFGYGVRKLNKYYPVAMKFSGYLLLDEDTSAIDFNPIGQSFSGTRAESGTQRIRWLDRVETFSGMNAYMGHCVVSIFEAIRQPVYVR